MAQRQRHLIVGQFRASRGTWFAENFGSLRIFLPISDWNDFNFSSKEALIHQASAPYMRTGKTQDSTRLRDESGFNKPWKAPKSPLAKKALRALHTRSSTDFRLVELEHHHTPRHHSTSSCNHNTTLLGTQLQAISISKRGNCLNLFCCVIGISCGSANVIGVCKSTQEEPMNTEAKIFRFIYIPGSLFPPALLHKSRGTRPGYQEASRI